MEKRKGKKKPDNQAGWKQEKVVAGEPKLECE